MYGVHSLQAGDFAGGLLRGIASFIEVCDRTAHNQFGGQHDFLPGPDASRFWMRSISSCMPI